MPEIITQNNGYLITWAEHNLTIKISRLIVHKDGHVTAFIKISLKGKNKSYTLLPAAQFNLSAPRTRSELANSLTDEDLDKQLTTLGITRTFLEKYFSKQLMISKFLNQTLSTEINES